MDFFEKNISNLIESQFPEVYRENGPNLVAFVKAYFEWLESSNNAIYHARRLPEYKDIDSTIDQFLIHFKNKYLNSIRFDTAVETSELVKHSLDLYRSKGTERSISLAFRSIFGVDAQVYFPSKDIFKTSDGHWVQPEYIELGISDNIKDFENSQIEGITSGATAFVDKYIKKRTNSSSPYVYLYFISNRKGDFVTGETIKNSSTGEIGPVIIGSTKIADVVNGGGNYLIGDIVSLISNNNGIDGLARVANTMSVTGKVSFDLIDGGWGYTSNSEVLISNNIVTLSNVVAGNTSNGANLYFQFETLIQPMANLSYSSLSNGDFSVGDTVYRKDTSNNIYAYGKVMDVTRSSTTNGTILISTDANNFFGDDSILGTVDNNFIKTNDGFNIGLTNTSIDANTLVFDSNSGAYATILSISDVSASANVMKMSDSITLLVSNSFTKFANNDIVYQKNGSTEVANATIDIVSYNGTDATIRLTNVIGSFYANTLLSRNTNASGNVVNITLNLGLINEVGDFLSTSNNIVYGADSGTTATITLISHGSGANFTLVNNFINTETVSIAVDKLGDYLTVELDAPDYGFPAPGVENANTFIEDALTFDTRTYGTINSIIITNNGNDYDAVPYVVLYQENISKYNKKDYIINLANSSGIFFIGEKVLQNDLEVGIVKENSTTNKLYLKRISFEDISYSSNLVGQFSNSSAVISSIFSDETTLPIGINANIIANTALANGSVTELEVVSSGYAYVDGELVDFSPSDVSLNNRVSGSARVYLGQQGKQVGFYKENNSVTSGNKYLQDGYYYQNFSYEIQSPITLNRYASILKNIFHIAGTQHFSKYVLTEQLDATTGLSNTTITIT